MNEKPVVADGLGVLFTRLKRMRSQQVAHEQGLERPGTLRVCVAIATEEISDEQLEKLFGIKVNRKTCVHSYTENGDFPQ